MPAPSLPPLPPRSATELVDGAVQLIRPQFGYFLRIATIGAIPALIQAVIGLVLFPTLPTTPDALLQQQLAQLPLTLLTYVFATVQSGAILIGALALLRGETLPTIWEAFLGAFRRTFALIGANLLLLLVMMILLIPVVATFAFASVMSVSFFQSLLATGTLGSVISVVLGVLVLAGVMVVFVSVFARSSLVSALVVAESLGPVESLKRSHFLSRGSYWLLAKTYGLVMLISIVVYGVIFALAAAFPNQQALTALVSVLLIPVVPIIGSIMLLSYADLRVRREGADLDAALDALAMPPGMPA